MPQCLGSILNTHVNFDFRTHESRIRQWWLWVGKQRRLLQRMSHQSSPLVQCIPHLAGFPVWLSQMYYADDHIPYVTRCIQFCTEGICWWWLSSAWVSGCLWHASTCGTYSHWSCTRFMSWVAVLLGAQRTKSWMRKRTLQASLRTKGGC